jgi:hypothetical protein
MKRYRLIRDDIIKNLIEFLDTVQFDALSNETKTEAMHKVNFCNWMIQELTENLIPVNLKYIDKKNKPPKDTSKRDEIIDEHFHDWELPKDMSDDDFEKLVNQFDAFLRGWEKEYNKKNPEKEQTKEREYKPHIDDVMDYCSLDEVIEFLKDDPELTDEERFELYYDERERRKPKEKGLTYEQLLKGANLKPPTKK